jgi:hypothetical protein
MSKRKEKCIAWRKGNDKYNNDRGGWCNGPPLPISWPSPREALGLRQATGAFLELCQLQLTTGSANPEQYIVVTSHHPGNQSIMSHGGGDMSPCVTPDKVPKINQPLNVRGGV